MVIGLGGGVGGVGGVSDGSVSGWATAAACVLVDFRVLVLLCAGVFDKVVSLGVFDNAVSLGVFDKVVSLGVLALDVLEV